jgi:hypothetical protein
MNWYITKIVYQIICGNGSHAPQFDEQLRLIAAEFAEEAFDKAMQIGILGEETFRNTRREVVQWKFVGVPEVHRLVSLNDGAELYSRITEADDANSFVSAVHQKASGIRKTSFPQQLQT